MLLLTCAPQCHWPQNPRRPLQPFKAIGYRVGHTHMQLILAHPKRIIHTPYIRFPCTQPQSFLGKQSREISWESREIAVMKEKAITTTTPTTTPRNLACRYRQKRTNSETAQAWSCNFERQNNSWCDKERNVEACWYSGNK